MVHLPPYQTTQLYKHRARDCFPSLSTNAQTALIYPDLNNESLLSIGQFCDDNCWALFTKKNVYIIKDDAVILNGIRNRTDGLWDIQLPDNTSLHQQNGVTKNNMNYIITKDKSKTELAQYLLATAYSPAISTFEYTIDNGNFVTWPGITELNFKKLIGTTIPIEKGHMDQERKNLRSTALQEEKDDFFPLQTQTKEYELFAVIEKMEPQPTPPRETAYSDQTG